MRVIRNLENFAKLPAQPVFAFPSYLFGFFPAGSEQPSAGRVSSVGESDSVGGPAMSTVGNFSTLPALSDAL